MINKVMRQVLKGVSGYKSFLHHVNKDTPTTKNVLKLKVPKKKIRPLENENIQKLLNSTTNIRDEFLIRLLYETGLRIGEALELFIEDIVCDHKNGHKIKLVYRGELENGACLKTGERNLNISQSLIDFFDDYEYEILDELEIDTNFLFVKLKGKNKGKPLEYSDVSDLFKKLKKKTGIDIHAHLLRYSYATSIYRKTKDIKYVQESLGHAQIQTTMNMYVHPSDEDIRGNWEIIQPTFEFKRKH